MERARCALAGWAEQVDEPQAGREALRPSESGVHLVLQLASLLGALLILLLLVQLMTNLLSRFLGAPASGRRQSASQAGQAHQSVATEFAPGSSLSLARSSPAGSTHNQDSSRPQRSRRSSRSSIHSLSTMFISALTGNQQSASTNNNGNKLILRLAYLQRLSDFLQDPDR